MPFINPEGYRVSYDCDELIIELQSDILEFGDDLEVLVATIIYEGVKLYKDYNFIEDDAQSIGFPLNDNESVEKIKATELLALYIEQNKVI